MFKNSLHDDCSCFSPGHISSFPWTYIQHLGVQIATWSVLYYIADLLRSTFLFVELVLIGTGWAFIKHVLVPKEKRLLMAIIHLQVLANVAEIILEESKEGTKEHLTWRKIFISSSMLWLQPVFCSLVYFQGYFSIS